MQFTSKFILIALALACTAVSAAPVSTIAPRSDAGDDMELFVRAQAPAAHASAHPPSQAPKTAAEHVSPFATQKFTISDDMFPCNNTRRLRLPRLRLRLKSLHNMVAMMLKQQLNRQLVKNMNMILKGVSAQKTKRSHFDNHLRCEIHVKCDRLDFATYFLIKYIKNLSTNEGLGVRDEAKASSEQRNDRCHG